MAAVQAWQSVTWDGTKSPLMTLSEEDFTPNIRCDKFLFIRSLLSLTAAQTAHETWMQTVALKGEQQSGVSA